MNNNETIQDTISQNVAIDEKKSKKEIKAIKELPKKPDIPYAIVNRLLLLEQLKSVSIVTPTKSNLPVVTNIKLRCGVDAIEICATDLDIYISKLNNHKELIKETNIEVAGHEFEICIPPKIFIATLQNIDTEYIKIFYDAKSLSFKIETETGLYSICAETPEYFPAMTDIEVDENQVVVLNKDILLYAYKQVACAVCNYDLRPAMQAVKIEIDLHKIKAVATDAHRLMVTDFATPSLYVDDFLLVPSLFKLIEANLKTGDVSIYRAFNKMVIKNDTTRIIVNQINATFPVYGGLIPNPDKCIVSYTLINKELQHILKRMLIFIEKSFDASPVILNLQASKIIFEVLGDTRQSAREFLNAEAVANIDDSEFKIGLDAAKFYEICQQFDCEEVRLFFYLPGQPILILPIGQQGFNSQAILMPKMIA